MKRVLLLALLLACVVVPLGAYVRLSHAGLGCPDWPGCYGRWSPHHAAPQILAQHAANPYGPVSMVKAWTEMAHRYLASLLGVCLLLFAILAWRRQSRRRQALGLLLLVSLQGALGMWTVTLLLKPVIVSAHLLGGMSMAALLAACCWQGHGMPSRAVARGPYALAWLLPLLLLLQIALGGWVSSHGAALACQGFPACNGQWWPHWQGQGAFQLWRSAGEGPDGQPLSQAALITMHWTHRLGALLLLCVLPLTVWRLWHQRVLRPLLAALLVVLLLQLCLGVANVLLQLPLPLAVAHNAGAMLLLMLSLCVLFSLHPSGSPS